MKKSTQPLPHEIAPGVFRANELQPVSLDNVYNCRSHNQGDSATVPTLGLLEFSGYMGILFRPQNPRQERDIKISELLRSGFHPTYQRETEEATRVSDLAYYDSRVSGYVGQLVSAQGSFKNASKTWKKYTTEPDERRNDANLFLNKHTHEIIGLKGFFDEFVFDGKDAVLSLKKLAQSLKVRTVTQRRMNVFESGAYIASRRGNIWVAINDSRMSDMPYFNHAAPLAGLAIAGTKKQHTASYKQQIITPVVIGQDGAPYIAQDAFSSPFTLRSIH